MQKYRPIYKALILLLLLLVSSSFTLNNNNNTVYICMKGEVYHSVKSCKGLRNVKSKIIAVSKSEAEKKYKRRPCKICY
jgi:hypothetical protein